MNNYFSCLDCPHQEQSVDSKAYLHVEGSLCTGLLYLGVSVAVSNRAVSNSVAVITDTSVRSPQILDIFTIRNNIFWLKVSETHFLCV